MTAAGVSKQPTYLGSRRPPASHYSGRVNLRPEHKLILACARTGSRGAGRTLELLDGPIDWDFLCAQATEQAVLQLVYRRMAALYPDRVPEPVLTLMAEEARWLTQISQALTHELVELLELFSASDVPALPFKGPTLGLQAYGDPAIRSFADLDILVRPANLEEARAVLLDGGFRPSFPTTPARRALLLRRGSHESFERDDGTYVELHWRIAGAISDFGLDYDRLWSRLGVLSLGGIQIPALEPVDLLLVLCIHGAKHSWERLGWLCDVAELVRRTPNMDWAAVISEAERLKAGRIVGLGLLLAHELLDAPLSPHVAARVRSDRALAPLAGDVRDWLFQPPRAGAGSFRFHLGTRIGWWGKAELAIRSLTALNQQDLGGVRLPDAMLPLYYVARPVRLVAKAVRHAARGPQQQL